MIKPTRRTDHDHREARSRTRTVVPGEPGPGTAAARLWTRLPNKSVGRCRLFGAADSRTGRARARKRIIATLCASPRDRLPATLAG